MLDENYQLIQAIQDQQSKPGGGKPSDCVQYQQVLHRNLVYLATLADSGNSNLGSLLPAPGNVDRNWTDIQNEISHHI